MMPDAEQVAPDPVHVAAGEVRVVLRGDPGRQLLAARRPSSGALWSRRANGNFGGADLPGPLVLDLALRLSADDLVQRLGRLHGRAADLLAAAAGSAFSPTCAKYAAVW